jgi:hypothetical protein
MSDAQSIDELMGAIGPAMQLGEVRAYPDQSAWALVFDEDRIIFAEHDGEEARLWLSSEIAPVPGTGRLELMERLMMVNGLWRETGGSRLALDGPGEHFLLACDVRADLSLDEFTTVLGNFVDALAAWRQIVAAAGAGKAAEPRAGEGAIRA